MDLHIYTMKPHALYPSFPAMEVQCYTDALAAQGSPWYDRPIEGHLAPVLPTPKHFTFPHLPVSKTDIVIPGFNVPLMRKRRRIVIKKLFDYGAAPRLPLARWLRKLFGCRLYRVPDGDPPYRCPTLPEHWRILLDEMKWYGSWDPPRIGSPFPSQCRLHPYFQHRTIGEHPIDFDIGYSVEVILKADPHVAIPLAFEEREQPATYPFSSRMLITHIADDNTGHLQWPIIIENPRGLTVADVLKAIYVHFQEHVDQADYEELGGGRRRDQVIRTYWNRVLKPVTWHEIPGEYDGLRRIDFMVGRTIFRGLEPNKDEDYSWTMFLGP